MKVEDKVEAEYNSSNVKKARLHSTLAALLDDPLLADLPKKPTLSDVDTLISLELGSAMRISVLKLDHMSFGSMSGQIFAFHTIMRNCLMTMLPFRITAYVIILRCILFPASRHGLLKGIQGGENTGFSMVLTEVHGQAILYSQMMLDLEFTHKATYVAKDSCFQS